MLLINKIMSNKANHFPNMTTFTTVRRGDWRLKVSIHNKTNAMVVAQHLFDGTFYLRFYSNLDKAADFIDHLIETGVPNDSENIKDDQW